MREEFLELYEEVFDAEGNIKACGRDKCKKLMLAAKRLDNRADYGNIETGFMDISELHELYKWETRK